MGRYVKTKRTTRAHTLGGLKAIICDSYVEWRLHLHSLEGGCALENIPTPTVN